LGYFKFKTLQKHSKNTSKTSKNTSKTSKNTSKHLKNTPKTSKKLPPSAISLLFAQKIATTVLEALILAPEMPEFAENGPKTGKNDAGWGLWGLLKRWIGARFADF
jgi:hypothetical protein